MNSFPLPRFDDESLHHEFVVVQQHFTRDVRVIHVAGLCRAIAMMVRAGGDSKEYE
jgi:hypothetical protein